MPNYTEFMMRHGESGVQVIIEQIERIERVVGRQHHVLEARWDALMDGAANDDTKPLKAE